ncbi:MAG TPA: hypothetical protein VK581_15210 [Chthoniobacterales bacterium]|nr:hypothetical protein [Chthoniobacterales bacterium]
MRRNPVSLVRSCGSLALLLAGVLASRLTARADFMEKVHDALSLNDSQNRFHLQLSGLVDLETYFIDQPAPALILTERDFLFNPRLTLFLDAQIGSTVYFFAQTRVDRGFDPSDDGAQIRLDEYFLRYSPTKIVNFQIGQFATVVGNWVSRHDSWQNPFINAPLPYENLTGVWDSWAPEDADELLEWGHVGEYDSGDYSDKYLRVPIIWGPSYASGIAISGSLGRFDYAAEMKNAALASRPESWSITQTGFEHPTFNGRLGFRPDEMWNLGFSTSAGPYFTSEAGPSLPVRRSIGDYRELMLAQDLSFAWHHLQLWAEFFETRFEVPRIGNADTFSYYFEAKYKLTPQLFGALRWNQQLFGTIRDEENRTKWGNDIWRIDAAFGYRFTDYLQGKIQYSFSHQNSAQEGDNLVAAQLTVKF